MDTYKMDMSKDTLFRGEFPVVQKLVEKLADGAAAKNVCDKVVDKNGTPKTGGTGIKQLRENIAESKLSYEMMDDASKAEVALSSGKCAIPADQLKVGKTFVQFMEENSGLRTLIEEGKGDLQWERDIPPAALANLEELAKKDFKGNLGTIIHDIYQTAHLMFGDMPQGDHKKRAKYRFASKTLMRLLPKELLGQVEGLIEKKTITLDLYDILGQCTWGQK